MGTICIYHAHRTFMTANPDCDTVEFILDDDGSLTIDALHFDGTPGEQGQAIIKLRAGLAEELRRFLARE